MSGLCWENGQPTPRGHHWLDMLQAPLLGDVVFSEPKPLSDPVCLTSEIMQAETGGD